MSAREINVYGMTIESIEEEYMNSITAKCCGLEMVVAGILSDVQECVSMSNRPEQVRQQLNVAKYILNQMTRQRQAKEAA